MNSANLLIFSWQISTIKELRSKSKFKNKYLNILPQSHIIQVLFYLEDFVADPLERVVGTFFQKSAYQSYTQSIHSALRKD